MHCPEQQDTVTHSYKDYYVISLSSLVRTVRSFECVLLSGRSYITRWGLRFLPVLSHIWIAWFNSLVPSSVQRYTLLADVMYYIKDDEHTDVFHE